MFFEGFAGTFDPLFAVLGDGLAASYLLARFQLVDVKEARFADPVETGFDLPPAEAIEYFRRKKVMTRKKFDKLTADARAAAFTVANIYRLDVLDGFKEEITKALNEGTPQREVIKKFRGILAGAGHKELGAYHLEVVFRSQMALAYGVGRRRALEDVTDDLPYWRYNAVLDDRTRPAHRVLDGLIFPANHPFWNAHYPPWGFACRCSVTAEVDYPSDYNHKNPSGEAEIVYGRDGLPAKAEYGTAVYDLAVGKFKGVPPQGGLREVIEEASKRAQKERVK